MGHSETSDQTPDWWDEMFCGSDDGDPDCLYWLAADGRTEAEAVALVQDFVGEFPHGAMSSGVVGYVERTPEGWYFHKSPEGQERFWEVTSR